MRTLQPIFLRLPRRTSFGRYPHLARVARGWVWAVPVVAAFSVIVGLLEGLGVGLLIPLLSTLARPATAPIASPVLARLERFAQHAGFENRLIAITVTVFIVVAVKNVLAAASNLFAATLYGRIGQAIRLALAERLREAPYQFFLGTDSARLMNILGTESWQAVDAVRASFVRVASTCVVFVIGLILVLIDWKLALLVALGAVLARALQHASERRMGAMSSRLTASNDFLAGRMLFTVFGSRVIRLFGAGEAEFRRFGEASDRVRRDLLEIDRLSAGLWPGLETLHVLLFLIVLVTAVLRGVDLPELAAFLVLLNRMQPHLRTLEQATGAYAAASGQLAEVEWLLDPSNTACPPDGDVPFDGLRAGIRFEDVTFGYEGLGARPPALQHVSFEIGRGSTFALVGRSGAGKTTLVNLLARLLAPSGGEILIDGVPLGRLRGADWTRAVAVAGQDVDLFDGTIAENIAFGAPGAVADEIAAAARGASLDFLESLPDGLRTRVGDRGLLLSGGQRQRIGIARALIRKPQLLILDEATNAVDRLTEAMIVQVVRSLPTGTTVVLISHRAATLEICDAGILIEEGRLVDAGPIGNLIERLQPSGRDIGLPGGGSYEDRSRTLR